jgi:hypothetical protein
MSIIICPDCHEENFGSAIFCKKCGADFNKPGLFSRFMDKSSAYKSRRKGTLLLDVLDTLEEYGGPSGWSLRLYRNNDRSSRK